MNKRTSENCRWWKDRLTGYGHCHKRPPIVSDSDESFPSTHKSVWCGEGADKTITPEQEDRHELTRRFAVAIMSTEWGKNLSHIGLWGAAEKLAAAGPQIQREDDK